MKEGDATLNYAALTNLFA